MEETKKTSKRKRALLALAGLVLVLVAAITVYFALLASTQYRYTISDGPSVIYHNSTSTDIATVLEEAQVETGTEDRITDLKTSRNTVTILIERCMNITVEYQGESLCTSAYTGTVGDILTSLDITLSDGEWLTNCGQPIAESEALYDGMTICVERSQEKTYTKTVAVPYETITYLDPTLEEGTTRVKTAGAEGKQEITYLTQDAAGNKQEATVVSTRLLAAPVDEVLLVGTAAAEPTLSEQAVSVTPEQESTVEEAPAVLAAEAEAPAPSQTSEPTPAPKPEPEPEPTPQPEPEPTPEPSYGDNVITTSGGEVLSYSSVLSVEATAYTGGGTTATGTSARYGAIAVDPRVIPYGTRMYIVSDDGKWIYGVATAEDCGGAIQGNIIDLYFDDYDTCIQFGRRNCTVYILD